MEIRPMTFATVPTREQPRVLVAETEDARIYELWSPYGRPRYEVVRAETEWFSTCEAAAWASPDTRALFLAPGEAALVARPWDGPEPWPYEVWWVYPGDGNAGPDRGDLLPLHTTAKGQPAVATDPHVSVLAHVTQDELGRLLGGTDVVNGFANRFLWAYVKRSKLLSRGGTVSDVAIADLGRRIGEALAVAKTVGRMDLDPEAANLWDQVYPIFEAERTGVLDAVTARSSPQVLRLACVYALLDRSAVIGPEHLQAALAVWDFCDASACYLFGGAAGDPRAERVLREMRRRPSLDRADVNRLFSGHASAAEIDRIRDLLRARGAIRVEPRQTDGRSAEVWVAVP